MLLILKRLNPNTATVDIEQFIEPLIEGWLFRKGGHINSIRIQKLMAQDSDKAEFNALVGIQPDSVAERVIKNLDRKALRGKHINIVEFHPRHYTNDRRLQTGHISDDRRQSDRRRHNLEIVDVTTRLKPQASPKANVWSSDFTL